MCSSHGLRCFLVPNDAAYLSLVRSPFPGTSKNLRAKPVSEPASAPPPLNPTIAVFPEFLLQGGGERRRRRQDDVGDGNEDNDEGGEGGVGVDIVGGSADRGREDDVDPHALIRSLIRSHESPGGGGPCVNPRKARMPRSLCISCSSFVSN